MGGWMSNIAVKKCKKKNEFLRGKKISYVYLVGDISECVKRPKRQNITIYRCLLNKTTSNNRDRLERFSLSLTLKVEIIKTK